MRLNLQELKKKIPIDKVLSHYNIPIPDGSNNTECPFHNSENKKSLYKKGNNIFCASPGCFGGDAFSVVAKKENWDIKKDFMTKIVPKTCSIVGITPPQISPEEQKRIEEDAQRRYIIGEAFKVFHEETQKYIPMMESYIKEKRNITKKQLNDLKLGFFPKEEWDNIKTAILTKIPESANLKYQESKDTTKIFLNTFYNFVDCIIHPHFFKEEIIYFTGEITPRTPKYDKYGNPNNKYKKHRAIFSPNKQAEGYMLDSLLSENKELIVFAEGYWDVLKLNMFGIPAVSFGTCKISQYFIKTYGNYFKNFKNAVVMFDNESNNSGINGALAFCEKMLEMGIPNLKIVELPKIDDNKIDTDDFLNNDTYKENIPKLYELFEKAKPFLDIKIKEINDAEGEQKMVLLKDAVRISEHLDEFTSINMFETLRKNSKMLKADFNKLIQGINNTLRQEKIISSTNKEKLELDTTQPYNSVEDFYYAHPFFYDSKSQNFWVWDDKLKYWITSNKNSIFTAISNNVPRMYRNELMESKIHKSFMNAIITVGENKSPQPFKGTWIQFGHSVIDIQNGKTFNPSTKYFCTNPIPWSVGDSSDTPTIDNLFTQWVGENKKEWLYEVIAYCCLSSMPIHKIFCFLGIGRNGKGQFFKIISKFLGKTNISSSTLIKLAKDKFALKSLYKKLAVMLGETDFTSIDETSMLKQISGDDIIDFEFKGKDSFADKSYAKILINTNNVTPSGDTSDGWYSRWWIIEFPNQFKNVGKDVVDSIPEKEFNNLARKVIDILPRILKDGFTENMTPEDCKKRYLEVSQPFPLFIKKKCDRIEGESVEMMKLFHTYTTYLKEHKLRELAYREFRNLLSKEGLDYRRTSISENGKKANVYVVDDIILKSDKPKESENLVLF